MVSGLAGGGGMVVVVRSWGHWEGTLPIFVSKERHIKVLKTCLVSATVTFSDNKVIEDGWKIVCLFILLPVLL